MWPFLKRKLPDFQLPEGVRIYAIGDIHGKADLLDALFAEIERDSADFAGERVIEVFLGDYIDRGADSRAVIDRLLQAPADGHERICLRGNHEQALLDALQDAQKLRSWMQFGGLATLNAYGVPIPIHVEVDAAEQLLDALHKALPKAHLAFLQQLATEFECGGYYFVHAGVHPAHSLKAQKACDKLWIRDRFLQHSKPFEKYIVHGHSPVAEPDLLSHRANLDVSDAPSASLCALRIEGGQRRAILAHKGD